MTTPFRIELTPHPDSPPSPVQRFEVDVARTGTLLSLTYRAFGAISAVRVPANAPSGRADGLWRRTCVEAFVRGEGPGYWELNFSPSSQWAAYRFETYRAAMADAALEPAEVAFRAERDRLEVSAAIDLAVVPSATWNLGLSAVVEDAEGLISYWASRHPPGKPDFHHPDSFILDLP
ncbi:MAG: DOMON-like domain-containing protein [Alphaproteobacteria bacterium]|nr:DOMON-like domain-containing protein [Alphaproteobacteria bacterium]MBU2379249.1 DOMON-like domain-containing protein [Alphaproteobacteria bacterium]